MKKIVAMILCLALAIGCCAAVAETAEKESIGKVNVNGDFEIKCAIPEGYKVSITDASDDKIIAPESCGPCSTRSTAPRC